MSVPTLRYLFEPASIALIGASERSGSLGAALTSNLLAGGFKGQVFLVNRRHRTVQGRPAYQRLAHLPNTPELAIIATPLRTLPRLLLEAGQRGVKVVLIATPSHGCTEQAATVLQRAWRKAAHADGLRVLGPGSSGIMAPLHNLNVSLTEPAPLPGRLALISQSGTVLAPLLAWARAQGIGFSRVIGLGGAIDIEIADVLDWLVDDSETQAILLDLEIVRQARSFLSAARAAARIKPVIVLRPSDGSDAPSQQVEAVYDAAFRRAGLLRVPSLRALCGMATVLGHDVPVMGDRLAIVGNNRGLGLLAAETLQAEGGRLGPWSRDTEIALGQLLPAGVVASNPLDLGRDARPQQFAAALNRLLPEKGINGIVVLHSPNGLPSAEAAAAVIESIAQFRSRTGDSPCVLACWLGQENSPTARQRFHEQRIPTFDMPEDAIRAFMRRWHQAQNRIGLMATPPALADFFAADPTAPRQSIQRILAQGRKTLDSAETTALLEPYGIAIATLAATEPASLELRLRLMTDPIFGSVLALGTGGRTVGLLDESVVLLPPLNPVLAREAIRHTRIYQRLHDVHPNGLDGLMALLVQVARLVVDLAEVVELELNPILVQDAGVTVGAARLRVAATEIPAAQHLAIRPYPRELEETLALPDGSTLLIRPVRPEDEPTFVTGFTQLSTEEVRMRFMYTIKELLHEEAARLTQIDYDRDMALVVFRQRSGQPLERCGVARLMRDADGERAEFAIVLLRAATGIGLGSLLVRRLIRYARARGFHALFGEILRENEPMLALCRSMGFTIQVCPEDPGLMIATFPLA